MAVWRLPVNIAWSGNGSPGVNVWSLRTTTPAPSIVELQALTDIVRAFYDDLNLAGAAQSSTFAHGTVITCTEAIDRDTDFEQAVTFAQVVANGDPEDLPPANQIVAGWRTPLRARRGMGRTFIGPLSKYCCGADGTIETTRLGIVTAAAADLVTASQASLNGGIGVWGLVDANPVPGSPSAGLPHVHRDFTGSRIADRFAILRSRRD